MPSGGCGLHCWRGTLDAAAPDLAEESGGVEREAIAGGGERRDLDATSPTPK